MIHPTAVQIAEDWNLWCEYVNPSGAQTRAQFNRMTTKAKVRLQERLWPEDMLPIGDCDCPNCREARGCWSFEEEK